TWIFHLRRGLRDVQVVLPPPDALPPQVTKVLLSLGLLSGLEAAGVDLPPLAAQRANDSVCLAQPTKEHLAQQLSAVADRLTTGESSLSESAILLRDLFHTVAFELLENTFMHGHGAAPYYALMSAIAAGPKRAGTGLITAYPRESRYIELLIGDD